MLNTFQMETKITFLSVAILLLTPVINLYAQETESVYMPSGRPGYTTSASLVGKKSLLLETGVAYDNLGSITTVNTSTLRFGFTDRIEGRFSATESIYDGGFHCSNLSLAAKIGLIEKNNTKFSVLPKFSFPVDDNDPSGALALLYSVKLNENWSMSANAATRTTKGDDTFISTVALAAGRSLNDKLSLSAEFYCDGMANHVYNTYYIGVALAYQILPRLQLDLSTTRYSNRNLKQLADNWNIEAGLCWLIK